MGFRAYARLQALRVWGFRTLEVQILGFWRLGSGGKGSRGSI